MTQIQSTKVSFILLKLAQEAVPDESRLHNNYLHACYQETLVNIRE
jgi:hypothetical protein